ncbi:MAG: GTPase ObgE [Bacillota bacterium]|nr:GTPase ObgE [Bacillota bacterium]MDW7677612.1 GTPase ObgE [Bacillota bacterium]
MFVDQAAISLKAGDGGNGSVAFRRETYVPDGGPSGGDGGKGGDVLIKADANLRTLMDFRYKRHYQAEKGEDGKNKNMFGKQGENLVLLVPCGTLVMDKETGEVIADLVNPGDVFLAARGGKGGKGNARYKTATRQAPQFAQAGEQGEELEVLLELKLIADIGLLGFPNVGKSTLLSMISEARPKIANYHFTTLTPNLGVVQAKNGDSFVVADIPGLIEGAHEGVGLGLEFLRHVERTKVLIHVIDAARLEGRDPMDDFETLNRELVMYEASMERKPQIVAANKADLLFDKEQLTQLEASFRVKGIPFYIISAATGEGINQLMLAAGDLLKQEEVRLQALMPEENASTEERVITLPKAASSRFEIVKEDDEYVISGDLVRKLIYQLNMESMDSLLHFYRVLDKHGVIKKLKQMGVQEGDTVRIMEVEFEFTEEFDPRDR